MIGIRQESNSRRSPSRKRKLENDKKHKTVNLSNTPILKGKNTSRDIQSDLKHDKRNGVSPANRLGPLSLKKMKTLNQKMVEKQLKNFESTKPKKKSANNNNNNDDPDNTFSKKDKH